MVICTGSKYVQHPREEEFTVYLWSSQGTVQGQDSPATPPRVWHQRRQRHPQQAGGGARRQPEPGRTPPPWQLAEPERAE